MANTIFTPFAEQLVIPYNGSSTINFVTGYNGYAVTLQINTNEQIYATVTNPAGTMTFTIAANTIQIFSYGDIVIGQLTISNTDYSNATANVQLIASIETQG